MAKLAQNFAKYVICARLSATGIIEKPDIIGAIFGQTEGLLGTDLDLRELQRTGRIGRIEVTVRNSKGNSFAEIIIPSSLDASETALIAASLETIEKVGPCDARIEIAKVEDVRTQKRKYVIDRARDILRSVIEEGVPDSQRLSEMVKQAVRTCEVSSYHGLACGPGIHDSDELIIVEGRADVINLLRNGIRNCIAIEGSKIPEPVIDLTKQKVTVALLDGDRGGDLILRKLMSIADIDFVARAEPGKEVEELTKKQLFKAIRERTSADQIKPNGQEVEKAEKIEKVESEPDLDQARARYLSLLEDLIGSRAAYLLDRAGNILTKTPLSELSLVISDLRGAHSLVVDSKISQPLVDLALQYKLKALIGMSRAGPVQSAPSLRILTLDELSEAGEQAKRG